MNVIKKQPAQSDGALQKQVSVNNKSFAIGFVAAVAGGLAVFLLAGFTGAPQREDGSNSQDWSWIQGTTWYVKPQGLPSMLFKPATGEVIPTPDQTVYRIDSYSQGYFVGYSATKLGVTPVSCTKLMGSVTPEGALYLTFLTLDETGAIVSSVQAPGQMRLVRGQWTMENQMSKPFGSNLFFQHWAYMYQVKPGDPAWNNLPYVNMSVPDFLGSCQ